MFVIILSSFANAEIQTLGTFKLGDDISLLQICGTCTYNNITSVHVTQNTTKIIENLPMTRDGSVYNLTLTSDQASVLGEYIVNGIGDLDGTNTVWNYNFFVTHTGFTLTTGESVLYFLMTIVLFILIFIIFYLIFTLPSKDERDPNKGFIIRIVKLKYLRMVLIGIVYPLIIVVLNLLNGLAVNFATLNIFAGVIGFIFLAMLRVAWVYTIIIILWILYNLLRDTKAKDLIRKRRSIFN
jgi:hypothetical protein